MGGGEPFSLQDFKRWMAANPRRDFTLSGPHPEVESKVGFNRLVAKMDPEGGDARAIAREFMENGGRVVDSDGPLCLVEAANGSFVIPRSCVRRKV